MIAKSRLFLTADRCRVVLAHDPAAAFLFAITGQEIPKSDVDRFGLIDGLPKPEPQMEDAESRKTRVSLPNRTR